MNDKKYLASKLDLSGQGLTEIPEEIFKYRNLKTLNLRNNEIKLVSKDIGFLKHLKNLNLSNNKITTLGAKFFDLVNLEYLFLNNNKLKSFPVQVVNLTKLKALDLSGNLFSKLPIELTGFQPLSSLNLSNNQFTEFPFEILSLENLTHLWIGRNRFAEFPGAGIKNLLKNLTHLYCFGAFSGAVQQVDPNYAILQNKRGNVIDHLKLLPDAMEPVVTLEPKERKKAVAKVKKKQVFISYSHMDEHYKNEIVTALEGMQLNGFEFEYWVDTQIQPGDLWEKEIMRGMDQASIIILIVSKYFLASKFVQKIEIPTSLKKFEQDGTLIIPVIAKRCDFLGSRLKAFQSVNAPENPLASLDEDGQDIIYLLLVERIKKYLDQAIE
jgi:Leucine-rich repeat (LRR) protein